jgi:tetratricopeptide (TPR) repeat protein
MLDEVLRSVEQAAGWHAWIWRLRLAEARGEIALAREDWAEAVRRGDDAIAQSRATGRLKYEALGLWTRARALHGLGRTHEAIADLQRGVEAARQLGDPALFVRVATAWLGIAGEDSLLAETRTAAKKILAALPDEALRRRFETAEPLKILGNLKD